MSVRFEALLDRLGEIIKRAMGESCDRGQLAATISGYDVDVARFAHEDRDRLHELAEPLSRVIDLLADDAHWSSIFVMLADCSTDRGIALAVDRHEALLRDLDEIRLKLPPRRGKGRPPARTKDIYYALADRLASRWVELTGLPFTQAWGVGQRGRREPITDAAMFVYEIMKFVAPKSLRSLPKIMERIVTERRRRGDALDPPPARSAASRK